MNIAVVGYGEQGRSSFEYWFNQGHVVVICDQNTDIEVPPGAIDKLGPDYLGRLDEFDLIVRSPAVHPQTILDANSDHPEIIDKITSNTNEFFKVCPAPIIGVTGTKGKGTTSSLIARILQEAGKTVHLGGNIGIPPLDLLKNKIQESDIVVLELANFQLIDLQKSPHIAVCLMIVEEHLDWHKDMYEYVHSKRQIFAYQQPTDIAIYNANNVYSTEIVEASASHTKIPYDVPEDGAEPTFTKGAYLEGHHIKMRGKTVCSIKDIALIGPHNIQNVCAAVAATWDLIDQKSHVIKKVVQDFKGLPNRLEPVRKYNGVMYYNDSFSSAPDACVAAMNAIQENKVMIIGGRDRMLKLDNLIKNIQVHSNDIRKVLLIGESAERVANELKASGFSNFVISRGSVMDEIVKETIQFSQPGDSVILSPGFPSFDMFKNFEDRGNQFRNSVTGL